MIDNIKKWAESPEGKDAIKTTAFIGAGGLVGVIVNKLIGKKGLGYDIAAGIAGGLGGYGLKRMDDKDVSDKAAKNTQKEKDKRLVDIVAQTTKKPSSTKSGYENYTLIDAVIDRLKFIWRKDRLSPQTLKAIEGIEKLNSANRDAENIRNRAIIENEVNKFDNSLSNVWPATLIGGASGVGVGGSIDAIRWAKQKWNPVVTPLQHILGEAAYGKGAKDLGSSVIAYANNLSLDELNAAQKYFQKKTYRPSLAGIPIGVATTDRRSQQLADSFQDLIDKKLAEQKVLQADVRKANKAVKDHAANKTNAMLEQRLTDATDQVAVAKTKFDSLSNPQNPRQVPDPRVLNDASKVLIQARTAEAQAIDALNKHNDNWATENTRLQTVLEHAKQKATDYNSRLNNNPRVGNNSGIKLGNNIINDINKDVERLFSIDPNVTSMFSRKALMNKAFKWTKRLGLAGLGLGFTKGMKSAAQQARESMWNARQAQQRLDGQQ